MDKMKNLIADAITKMQQHYNWRNDDEHVDWDIQLEWFQGDYDTLAHIVNQMADIMEDEDGKSV